MRRALAGAALPGCQTQRLGVHLPRPALLPQLLALLPVVSLVCRCSSGSSSSTTTGGAGGPRESSAQDLQAALTAAIQSGAPSVTILGGTYRFAHGVSLLIHNATDLAIRAPDPVELVFKGSAGVSIVSATRVSLENIAIDYDPPPTKATGGITYALVNSTDVVTQDLTIRSAPFMAVTAFTGGGNHTFRRLKFAPHPGARWASQRDAIHFSDVRIGPTIEDSSVGWCGDDFLNIKNTLMLLLRCDSAISCIIINPHVSVSSQAIHQLLVIYVSFREIACDCRGSSRSLSVGRPCWRQHGRAIGSAFTAGLHMT